jgi:hypothetical protein
MSMEQVAAQESDEWFGDYHGSPGQVAQDARRALAAKAERESLISDHLVELELLRLGRTEARLNAALLSAARRDNTQQVVQTAQALVGLSRRRASLLGLDKDKAGARRPPAPAGRDGGDELSKRRKDRRAGLPRAQARSE